MPEDTIIRAEEDRDGSSVLSRFMNTVKYRDAIRKARESPEYRESLAAVPDAKRDGGLVDSMVTNVDGRRDKFFAALATISSPWTLPLLMKHKGVVAGIEALRQAKDIGTDTKAVQAVVTGKSTPHQRARAAKLIEDLSAEKTLIPERLRDAIGQSWHALLTSNTKSLPGVMGVTADVVQAVNESRRRRAVDTLVGRESEMSVRPFSEGVVSATTKLGGEVPALAPALGAVSSAFGGAGDAIMSLGGEVAGNVLTSERQLSEEEKTRANQRILEQSTQAER